jgi:hypothetical protein
MRLGGCQSWCGHGVKEKNSQPLLGIKPQSSDCPAHSQVMYGKLMFVESVLKFFPKKILLPPSPPPVFTIASSKKFLLGWDSIL